MGCGLIVPGCGLIVPDPTIPFGDHGAPVWGFDGEFVVNAGIPVANLFA